MSVLRGISALGGKKSKRKKKVSVSRKLFTQKYTRQCIQNIYSLLWSENLSKCHGIHFDIKNTKFSTALKIIGLNVNHQIKSYTSCIFAFQREATFNPVRKPTRFSVALSLLHLLMCGGNMDSVAFSATNTTLPYESKGRTHCLLMSKTARLQIMAGIWGAMYKL